MPKLIVSLPDSGEKTFEFDSDVIAVGRTEESQVYIEDASVSSRHATLTLKGGKYVMEDLGSTNGTRVNGEPATTAVLEHGDRVRFGKIEAHFLTESDGETRPLPQAENPTAELAEASTVPSDFSNASSFKTKASKKDPSGAALIGFSVVSILAFAAAIVSVFLLQPPQ